MANASNGNRSHPEQLELTTQPAARREPIVLTPPQAAALLAVRTSWVYEAAREDRIPHIHIGRNLRFIRDDLVAWVLAQRSP